MPDFLVASIVASVVLTVLLNVAIRMFPGAGRRAGEALDRAVERFDEPRDGRPGVRVVFPWRTMLVVSLLLTVLLNVVLLIAR